MTAAQRPGGRIIAVLGILLWAFSLRSAVASLSPVVAQITQDFPLSSSTVGLIGTAPPAMFIVSGLLAPMLGRRLGLERLSVIALIAVAVGLIGRGLVGDAVGMLAATALIFIGVGVGNVVLPPLVKKFFPDRLGLMMTVYTTAMSLSTFLPPLLAVPMADAAGWRFSLAVWGAFAVAGIIPWLILMRRPGAGAAPQVEVTPTGTVVVAPTPGAVFRRLARTPLVWALVLTFGTSSTMAYVAFAWLPAILSERAGTNAGTAGILLSLWAVIGLPASLLVPVLVVRLRATRPLFLVGALGAATGVLGLILYPEPALLWLWVSLFGLANLLFPLSLVLISIRSRTSESAVVLSSFVQSVGYVMSAIFPVLMGALHGATGSWTAPLWVIFAVLLLSIPTGMMAGRRRTVEDEWERRHGRW